MGILSDSLVPSTSPFPFSIHLGQSSPAISVRSRIETLTIRTSALLKLSSNKYNNRICPLNQCVICHDHRDNETHGLLQNSLDASILSDERPFLVLERVLRGQ